MSHLYCYFLDYQYRILSSVNTRFVFSYVCIDCRNASCCGYFMFSIVHTVCCFHTFVLKNKVFIYLKSKMQILVAKNTWFKGSDHRNNKKRKLCYRELCIFLGMSVTYIHAYSMSHQRKLYFFNFSYIMYVHHPLPYVI